MALEYGGKKGILNLSFIESAIGRPDSGYYRFINQKAAALVESVCCNHGFADGNKRTTVLLLDLLLDRSGYHLKARADEDIEEAVEELVISVANGQIGYQQLETWFKERITK